MTIPRRLLCTLVFLACALPALAQTPATYAQRATLAQSPAWLGRINIAAINGALAVIAEAPDTEQHAIRLRLAGAVLKEPEFISRRLAVVIAAAAPVVVAEDGTVDTTLTDAQLQGLVGQRWTAFANALVSQ